MMISEDKGDGHYHAQDSELPSSEIFQATNEMMSTHAILDSGASDNIVGVETLQDWSDQLEKLGFKTEDELYVDRQQHKKFTFGNNAISAALGKAYINVGIFGHQVELEMHVVEGGTPLLLSAKFLAEMNAAVNFRTGVVVFRKLGEQQYQMQRTAGGHLAIPLLAYVGNSQVYKDSSVSVPDPGVKSVHFQDSEGSECDPSADKGRPETTQH